MTTYSTINKSSTTSTPLSASSYSTTTRPVGIFLAITQTAVTNNNTYSTIAKDTTSYSTINKN